MKNILFAFIALFFFAVPEARAVDYPSNWSLDLKGGITSGFFTFDSKTTAQGGFQVRYSLNPVVSFYGDMAFGQFRSPDSMQGVNGFSTDYVAVGLGARLNILRMLTGLNSVTENFGLYGATGIGLMRGDVSVCDTNFPGYFGRNAPVNAVVHNITAGATYRISRRVDVFAQAEFNHSNSDLLDGYQRIDGRSSGRISGGDSFVNTSAGISIKFGSSRVRHADWQQYDHRTDPLAHSLQAELARMEAELREQESSNEELARRMNSLNQTINEFSTLINTAHREQFKTFDSQLTSMQNQLDMIQAEVDELGEQEVVHVQRPVSDENSFFVVAAVFWNRQNAERGLQEVRNEGFDQATIQQDQRRNYYLVTYSGHTSRQAAIEEMQRMRAGVNPDSWVFVK